MPPAIAGWLDGFAVEGSKSNVGCHGLLQFLHGNPRLALSNAHPITVTSPQTFRGNIRFGSTVAVDSKAVVQLVAQIKL